MVSTTLVITRTQGLAGFPCVFPRRGSGPVSPAGLVRRHLLHRNRKEISPSLTFPLFEDPVTVGLQAWILICERRVDGYLLLHSHVRLLGPGS